MKSKQNDSVLFDIIYSHFYKGNMSQLLPEYIKAKDNPTEENLSFRKKMEDELFPLVIKNIIAKLTIEGLEHKWPEKKLNDLIAKVPNIVNPSEEYLLSLREKVDMGCPVCRTRLVFVKRSNFETLSEHVSGDGNDYVSKKDAFGCPNENCEVHKLGEKWLEDGEGPFGGKIFEKVNYINGNHAPFRTSWRKMEAEKDHQIRLLKIKDHSLLLKYSTKADKNGNKNYLFTRFDFQLVINGTYYTSGFEMFLFSMRRYFNKNNRQYHFKEHISRVKSWDKRWWSKLSLNIAKIVWKNDYQQALEL